MGHPQVHWEIFIKNQQHLEGSDLALHGKTGKNTQNPAENWGFLWSSVQRWVKFLIWRETEEKRKCPEFQQGTEPAEVWGGGEQHKKTTPGASSIKPLLIIPNPIVFHKTLPWKPEMIFLKLNPSLSIHLSTWKSPKATRHRSCSKTTFHTQISRTCWNSNQDHSQKISNTAKFIPHFYTDTWIFPNTQLWPTEEGMIPNRTRRKVFDP